MVSTMQERTCEIDSAHNQRHVSLSCRFGFNADDKAGVACQRLPSLLDIACFVPISLIGVSGAGEALLA